MNGQSENNNLWLYRWFERFGWPRSYGGKVFLIAFVTTHIPLICFICYLFSLTNAFNLTLLGLLTLATVTGTWLFFLAFHQLLKPVLLARRTLSAYFNNGQVLQLPTRFRDEVGLLLKSVADAIQIFERNRIVLEQLAFEDPLTGLLNRRAADRNLQQSLNLALRNQLPLGIAYLDVDHFKRINDHYGHAVGDQVLVKLSQYLQDRLRGSDWVARWGGEEFLLVLFAEENGIRVALERIRSELASLRIIGAGSEIQFTVSIGLTMVNDTDNPQTCLERADQALYQAKQAGRNRVI